MCSVPGQSIVSNLTLLRDTFDYVSRTNGTGILVSSDQEKAFDRVDRSFLLKLLDHLGFGPSFCQWIATSYSGAFRHIIVNGYLSVTVNLFGRVTLSHPRFTSCVEVLACKIRDFSDIVVFHCPALKVVSLKLDSTWVIQQVLLKVHAHFTLSIGRFVYMSVVQEQSLICLKLRQCGSAHGEVAQISPLG